LLASSRSLTRKKAAPRVYNGVAAGLAGGLLATQEIFGCEDAQNAQKEFWNERTKISSSLCASLPLSLLDCGHQLAL
jgi:hypothetical protein